MSDFPASVGFGSCCGISRFALLLRLRIAASDYSAPSPGTSLSWLISQTTVSAPNTAN
jgi:hypothetical protein